MPTIQQIRDSLSREVEPSGRVRDTDLSRDKRWPVTVGEVVSVNPPTVELLNGRTQRMKWRLAGVTAGVGDIVLMLRLARVLIAIGRVEAI